jgi:hypothetical protein
MDERKTLEQRAQITDIERLRHSTAHVLVTAILCHPDPATAGEGSHKQALNHTNHE